ncbi:leukotriene B4 receptor 2a [Brachyhypopomus gauderio]|uniref:leukotriene B4 receptor 2a n=1 Tax=Brachyhypopomus gauderio TaxID=698409 RepID=UPI004043263F
MATNHTVLPSTSRLYSGLYATSSTAFSSLVPNLHTTPNSNIMSYNAGPITGALILTAVFLVGVPGNLFVIWSVLARTRRQSVTTLLILNLAFADGGLMVLVPFFMVYLMRRSWVFGLVMCKVLYYLCCANMYASILLISLMSLHRMVAVVWPQRIGALTARRTVVPVLALLWVLSLALATPVLVFRTLTPMKKEGQELKSLVCDCIHTHNIYVVVQYGMETFLGFLLPYGLIVGSYVCILRRIRQTKFRRRIRSEKLILAIIITFGLLWLPYHVINMIQVATAFYPETSPARIKVMEIRSSLRAFVSTMGFISSCINPVLYTLAARVYIQRAGAAFMARLFDATGLDSSSRKGRLCSQNSRDPEHDNKVAEELHKESESTISDTTSYNLKAMSVNQDK